MPLSPEFPWTATERCKDSAKKRIDTGNKDDGGAQARSFRKRLQHAEKVAGLNDSLACLCVGWKVSSGKKTQGVFAKAP